MCYATLLPRPPPPRRKFEIKFALRRIGILAGFAVCILTFAAPDAQAQTSCEAGERLVTNINGSGCFPNAAVDIVDDCIAAEWTNIHGTFITLGELGCDIPVQLYHTEEGLGFGSGDFCAIDGLDHLIQCTDMFGDPPQFPKKADFPDLGNEKNFVANCAKDGTIPGAIPATINTIGATECTCDRDSGYAGTWPNCIACENGEGILADGTCGVCPELLENGICVACPFAGQVVNNSGACVCPNNHSPFGGVCLPDSGDDFGELSDAVLCEVFGGEVLKQSLPPESEQLKIGVSAESTAFPASSPAAVSVFVAMTNAIQAKFRGDIVAVNAFLSRYDTGGADYNAYAYIRIVFRANRNYGSGTFSDSNSNELARILSRVPVDFSGTICSGMDSNDTFCIIDSADAFPCRGLFKHLRSCNLQFNRKALNPFFCGEKCGVQKAVGSECR